MQHKQLTFFMYCISMKLILMTLLISKNVFIDSSFFCSKRVTSIASDKAMRFASGMFGYVSSSQLRIIFFKLSMASILACLSLKSSRPVHISLTLWHPKGRGVVELAGFATVVKIYIRCHILTLRQWVPSVALYKIQKFSLWPTGSVR